ADVLTELLKKPGLLVPNTSQHGRRQRPCFLKQSGSSSRRRNQSCNYHRMYEGNAKKCQPDCKYPKTDTIVSQRNSIGSEVSVIPHSVEKCF
ncbi:unnamed protein product, partial [Hymenolepis diminuta]